MPHRSPEEVLKRSHAAWDRKMQWNALLTSTYFYAMPGKSQFFEGEPVDAHDDHVRGSEENFLYDSTLPRAVYKLANKVSSAIFPIGTEWADLEQGKIFPQDAGRTAKERTALLQDTKKAIFHAINVSNFYLTINEMLIDAIVGGTGIMKVIPATNEPGLVSFDSTSLSEVALEAGSRGSVVGIYRTMWLTPEEIETMWVDAKSIPNDMEEGEDKDGMPPRYTITEATWYDHEYDNWQYNVIMTGGKEAFSSGEGAHVLLEKEYPVNPWIILRWNRLPNEVYGRSPAMDALPDARTLNEVVATRLTASNVRATGMYVIKSGSTINEDTLEIGAGSCIVVENTDTSAPDIAPLPLAGDIQSSEIVSEDLRTSIKSTMLVGELPPQEGAVRSATEILERMREVKGQIGAPFSRIVEEVGRPVLRAVAHILNEAGELPVAYQSNKGGLRIDGTDAVAYFKSPLVQAQRLADVQSLVEFSELARSSADPVAFTSAVDQIALVKMIADKLQIDTSILKEDDVAAQELASLQQGVETSGNQRQLGIGSPTDILGGAV